MRFAEYSSTRWFGWKIDWDEPPALTDEVRAALRPQDAADLRVGVLRKRYVYEPSKTGHRSRHVRATRSTAVHPKGALVFTNADETYFWIEVDEDAP